MKKEKKVIKFFRELKEAFKEDPIDTVLLVYFISVLFITLLLALIYSILCVFVEFFKNFL